MYWCPSWILSTPFGVPSPLALTVADPRNEAVNVRLNGNLDPASEILLDIANTGWCVGSFKFNLGLDVGRGLRLGRDISWC